MDHQFKPAWWMTNRHAQTILPRFFRPNLSLDYVLSELATPDGDFLQLAWSQPFSEQSEKPLALVLHGLEGNIDSFYAKGMMKALHLAGFDVVLMHFRNCGFKPNLLPRAYHSGETTDLRHLVCHLKHQFPHKPLMAVGFSLGGNVLTKYLGEFKENALLDAAAVVSAPFALASSCKVIQTSCFKLYQKYLLDRLKKSTSRKLEQIKETIELSKQQLDCIYNLWEFDDKITAPLHGFKNAAEYYQKASGKPFLKHIKIPTLVVHAADDPMLSAEAVPNPHEVSEHVTLAVSERGGHVGFIAGRNPFKPIFWLEKAVPDFFTQQLTKL